MNIQTDRLHITRFTPDMAQAVHLNSLDEDTRRFVPDEVFETVEAAQETVDFLITCYDGSEGPFVYPILLTSGENIGYVQLAPVEGTWEIGYHIAKAYTGHGYATEAVRAFLPVIMDRLGLKSVLGVCLADNLASRRVMEKCGFIQQYTGMGNYQGAQRNICKYIYSI